MSGLAWPGAGADAAGDESAGADGAPTVSADAAAGGVPASWARAPMVAASRTAAANAAANAGFRPEKRKRTGEKECGSVRFRVLCIMRENSICRALGACGRHALGGVRAGPIL